MDKFDARLAETLVDIASTRIFINEIRRRGQCKADETASLTDTQHTVLARLQSSATFAAHTWPRLAAGATPATRAAAAEASAAAAAAWATTALGLEAKAESTAARAACQPAAEHASLALEWEAAAAAWRAAFEQLELAKQADPGLMAVQEAEEAIKEKRGFKQQRQQFDAGTS
ncbi:expressed protein [Chlorella variabilis]|uniref:Expressed protein n=1 Tax=Chlorella variabilis TaxID=554065 RepID=E1Z6P6_CHLVA|nr:expressed protein [Chlorella variabilis]EFN58386.1 expressed protein [Chlorella variabilis]|eukprot:XP_005850488.1 expressed protein [Chlorella variabilis]